MAAVPEPAPGIAGALAELFSPQRLGLLLGIAAIVALIFGGWIWSRTPDYRVLYANVSDRDGGAIVAALQQMNVPYKFAEGGGAIMVPDNQVHEMRLRLASQGLPRGNVSGFELMENPRLGASQFHEQVNYQRALEGELARSIQSIATVQSARVHLAMAKQTVFVRDQQKPSASVILQLHAGRTLEPHQVNAIVHLVSSSVPDLPVKNVTVVDQAGSLLSAQAATANGNGNGGLDASQLKYLREVEAGHVRRIEAILAPVVGAANFRAQVTADLDFSKVERAEEVYKPNQNPAESTVRSQQASEAMNGGPAAPGGVPGALSNQPPAPATAPVNPPAAPAKGQPATSVATGPVSTRKDTTVNYEVDKTIRHVVQPVGTVKRLSVAVVVNHRKQTDGDGKVTSTPLTPEELKQITDLVKEAIGFNQERGDTLNVANSPFAEADKVTPVEVAFWQNPEYIEMAKSIGKNLLIAGIVLYLVLGVLRPILRNLAQSTAAAREAPAPVQLPGEAPPPAPGQAPRSYQANLDIAKEIARQEPQMVASVVKNWVAGGNE